MATHNEELSELAGAFHYAPSIDDVATILQCKVASFQGTPSRVLTVGPFHVEDATRKAVLHGIIDGKLEIVSTKQRAAKE